MIILRGYLFSRVNTYDNNPNQGDNVYRIKVNYLDGLSKLSATKTINFKGLQGLNVFPNPANTIINIDLSSYKHKAVDVYLYNNLGQQKSVTNLENVVNDLLELDISNHQVGHYMLRIVSKGKRDVIQSIIITN